MKLLTILSSKYWLILPAIFAISLFGFIAIMFLFGPLDTIAENHIDVRVNNVQPACVEVTLLNQKSNSAGVNITCSELLQHPNRKLIEEEIAWDLYDQKYTLEQYADFGWLQEGSGIASTFAPHFSAPWAIEKNIGSTPIVLSGTAQADVVYIMIAIILRVVVVSFFLSFFVLFLFFFIKLAQMLRRKKSA